MWNYEKRLQYPVNIKTPNAKIAQIIMSQYGGPDGGGGRKEERRTKGDRVGRQVRSAGGCGGTETLSVPEAFRTGTDAIRQECLMHSRLSAPQARYVKYLACPVRNVSGTLRACLKIAFCKMCVTVCGEFVPESGGVAGYAD